MLRSFISVVERTRQPSPTSPTPVVVGHVHVGEVDLVELGLAGHLRERTHVDPGGPHVDDEVA